MTLGLGDGLDQGTEGSVTLIPTPGDDSGHVLASGDALLDRSGAVHGVVLGVDQVLESLGIEGQLLGTLSRYEHLALGEEGAQAVRVVAQAVLR